MEMSILLPLLIVGLLGLMFVLVAFRQPAQAPVAQPSREATGRALYQQRLQELDAELALGLLNESAHAEAVSELGLALLEDQGSQSRPLEMPTAIAPSLGRAWQLGFALLFCVGVAGLYLGIGEPQADALSATSGILQQRDVDPVQLTAWQRTLEQRVATKPDDQQSWYLLGHVHLRAQAFEPAAQAFAQAHRVALAQGQASDVNLDLYWLQARYLAARGQLDEGSQKIVKRVLEKAPNHPFILEILAMDAFRLGDYKQAVSVLNRALSGRLSPPQRATLQVGLEQARERLGSQGPGVDIRIEGLAAAPAQATLFVIARPVGGGMPFAVVRRPGPDFPSAVRLDDAVSMNPANPLSNAGQFEVLVRLSRSGGVQARPEDWQWQSEPIALAGAAGEGLDGAQSPTEPLVATLSPPAAAATSPH